MRTYTPLELRRINARRPHDLHRVSQAWELGSTVRPDGGSTRVFLFQIQINGSNDKIYALRAFGEQAVFFDGSYRKTVQVLLGIGYNGSLPYGYPDDLSTDSISAGDG